jgi:hypothetical protein
LLSTRPPKLMRRFCGEGFLLKIDIYEW